MADPGAASHWASTCAKTLARRLRRQRRQGLGHTRAQALHHRTELIRLALQQHWELSDTLGFYDTKFADLVRAAELLQIEGSQDYREILAQGNWARHASPPGSKAERPALPAQGLRVELLEDFRVSLFSASRADHDVVDGLLSYLAAGPERHKSNQEVVESTATEAAREDPPEQSPGQAQSGSNTEYTTSNDQVFTAAHGASDDNPDVFPAVVPEQVRENLALPLPEQCAEPKGPGAQSSLLVPSLSSSSLPQADQGSPHSPMLHIPPGSVSGSLLNMPPGSASGSLLHMPPGSASGDERVAPKPPYIYEVFPPSPELQVTDTAESICEHLGEDGKLFVVEDHCPQGHFYRVWSHAQGEFNCDRCEVAISSGDWLADCRQCDHSVCRQCCRHPHHLSDSSSLVEAFTQHCSSAAGRTESEK